VGEGEYRAGSGNYDYLAVGQAEYDEVVVGCVYVLEQRVARGTSCRYGVAVGIDDAFGAFAVIDGPEPFGIYAHDGGNAVVALVARFAFRAGYGNFLRFGFVVIEPIGGAVGIGDGPVVNAVALFADAYYGCGGSGSAVVAIRTVAAVPDGYGRSVGECDCITDRRFGHVYDGFGGGRRGDDGLQRAHFAVEAVDDAFDILEALVEVVHFAPQGAVVVAAGEQQGCTGQQVEKFLHPNSYCSFRVPGCRC